VIVSWLLLPSIGIAAVTIEQFIHLCRPNFVSEKARPPLKTLVAIANKHARMIWAILAKGEAYDPDAWRRWTRTVPTTAPATTGMTSLTVQG